MVLAGLIFGFLVGVGLVAGLKYVMDKRSKWRIQKVPYLRNYLLEKKSGSLSCFPLWFLVVVSYGTWIYFSSRTNI